jgi:hypothetical protein
MQGYSKEQLAMTLPGVKVMKVWSDCWTLPPQGDQKDVTSKFNN